MITCTRRLQFCAGHRVMGHENKCAHLHGHNYVVWLTARPKQDYEALGAGLDAVGRVVDFVVLKHALGNWIERNWDHGFIINEDDCVIFKILSPMRHVSDGTEVAQKLYTMKGNPTAENLARHLLEVIGPIVLEGTAVELVKVTIDETENCSATVTKKGYNE